MPFLMAVGEAINLLARAIHVTEDANLYAEYVIRLWREGGLTMVPGHGGRMMTDDAAMSISGLTSAAICPCSGSNCGKYQHFPLRMWRCQPISNAGGCEDTRGLEPCQGIRAGGYRPW